MQTSKQSMIGILGGTFDPIHIGHLRAAIELSEQLPLSEIRFMPCKQPVLKKTLVANAAHRINMLHLALAGYKKLIIDERELQRDTPSYTINSLQAIHDEMPDRIIALILGSDAFRDFDQWHRWQEILNLGHLIIIPRPHYDLPTTGPLAALLHAHQVQDFNVLTHERNGKIWISATPLLTISAREIRKHIAAHLDVRYLVPDEVLKYIVANGLYLS
jgi:nicotinate-nucleotide adenylyltransferase